MTQSSWVDYGMFMQNIMLAAHARSLDTCPQWLGLYSPSFSSDTFPELDQGIDVLVISRRGLLLGGALFALFCFTLELERLGQAFGRNPQD
jgi:hypothetical protein